MISLSFITLSSGSHHWRASGSAPTANRSYYCGPIHENSGYDVVDNQFVGPYIITRAMPAGINFRSPLIIVPMTNAYSFYSDEIVGEDPYQIVATINNTRTDGLETYENTASFTSIGVSSSVNFQSPLYTVNFL